MKKTLPVLIILLYVFFFPPVRCGAEDYVEKYMEYAEEGKNVGVEEFFAGERKDEEGNSELDSFLASLPKNVADMLPEGLSSDPAGAAESFGFSYFIGLILDEIGRAHV